MDKAGQCAGMADISGKDITVRRAVAEGTIEFKAKAFKALMDNQSPKGNVFETAKIAGIMAAKSTPSIIPLCHPLNLEKVKVLFEPAKAKNAVRVTAEVLCAGKTGVEMEALAAVSAACLAIYDMMKWAGQDMVISGVQLVHKSGGKTGVWQR
ncbi:MAG: cyclic pyranopterin monophosphate synthase MoaC [Candidatus Omnitrophica bacterium]|nr:cyclic pyranopterin monophosphate synthase MoaC [Candidatus Omnitrophota bacterium]